MVICCIGTPKVLGDSIAPRVADFLLTKNIDAFIYGTTTRPITALNYSEYLDHINKFHKKDFVIAVDCALGKKENIGAVKIIKNGVSPGKALNKNLQSIGDIGILGQVGDIANEVYNELKNTPVELVDVIVHKICNIILHILDYYKINQLISS